MDGMDKLDRTILKIISECDVSVTEIAKAAAEGNPNVPIQKLYQKIDYRVKLMKATKLVAKDETTGKLSISVPMFMGVLDLIDSTGQVRCLKMGKTLLVERDDVPGTGIIFIEQDDPPSRRTNGESL